jgi:hypothetical protein
MKAGGKAMTKGAMTKTLSSEHSLKQKTVSEVINSMVAIATKEVNFIFRNVSFGLLFQEHFLAFKSRIGAPNVEKSPEQPGR